MVCFSRLLLIFLCVTGLRGWAQFERNYMTPEGIFDTLFDANGVKYNLENLDVTAGKAIGGGFTVTFTTIQTLFSTVL